MMINKVILIGNLGKDPESFAEGRLVKFSLATTEKYKNKDGEKQKKTEWHSVKCTGNTAVNVMKFLSKGSKVFVEGKIEYSSYEKDGVKKYSTDIFAEKVKFLDGKKKDQMRRSDDETNDDLPF